MTDDSAARQGFVRRFVVPASALLLAVSLVHATRVRSLNLEEMTGRAERIFSGRCLDVQIFKDPQLDLPVTVATFEVDRVLKGGPATTITVKQVGHPRPGSNTSAFGTPTFKPGEEVVLFLYGTSAEGFSSPVGLGQGKFEVFTDKQGRQRALNGFGNRHLFDGLSNNARRRLGAEANKPAHARGIKTDALFNAVLTLRR